MNARATTTLLTATALAAFAANSLLCRKALGTGAIDAVSFTTLRLLAGAATLALLARRRPGGGSWSAAACLFAYALCFSLAYRSIAAGTGALLLFGAVQLTMLAAGLRAGERPPARTWLGLLLAVVGLVVLTAPGLTQPEPLGALLMATAGFAWGLYSLHGRTSTSPLRANADNFARCVPLAILASLLALPFAEPTVTTNGALLAIASGALASGIGYAIWYAALAHLRASQAAIVQLTVPPLAAFGGVLLLDETADLRLLLASAAILGGVALAVRAGRCVRPPSATAAARSLGSSRVRRDASRGGTIETTNWRELRGRYSEIRDAVDKLAKVIGAGPSRLPTYGSSMDFACPHVEVHGDEYHWVVVERGQENDRKVFTKLDDLLFQVFRSVTFSLSSDWELAHRAEGQDSRRLLFQTQVELLRRLNPSWAEREQSRHEEILREHPFDDAPRPVAAAAKPRPWWRLW